MTRGEYVFLTPWLSVGVGVRLEEEPRLVSVRKGYLKKHADGTYSLTKRGKDRAAKISAREDV